MKGVPCSFLAPFVVQKSFDSLTGTSLLKSVWVSQASAVQRRGRAGRTRPNGVCFHLFSRQRFASFEPFQQPELLRLPLQELCLQVRLSLCPSLPPDTALRGRLWRCLVHPAASPR